MRSNFTTPRETSRHPLSGAAAGTWASRVLENEKEQLCMQGPFEVHCKVLKTLCVTVTPLHPGNRGCAWCPLHSLVTSSLLSDSCFRKGLQWLTVPDPPFSFLDLTAFRSHCGNSRVFKASWLLSKGTVFRECGDSMEYVLCTIAPLAPPRTNVYYSKAILMGLLCSVPREKKCSGIWVYLSVTGKVRKKNSMSTLDSSWAVTNSVL